MKIKFENELFSKKTLIFIISDLFFVYKIKILKKWQIPLNSLNINSGIKLMLWNGRNTDQRSGLQHANSKQKHHNTAQN